jgi:hypothetical protein
MLKMPMQMRRAALISALSQRVKDIVVCDDLLKLDGKASSAVKLMHTIADQKRRILVVADTREPLLLRSMRNLAQVVTLSAHQLTTFHVMYADVLVMTSGAVHALEARLAPTSEKVAAVVEASNEEVASAVVTKTPRTKVASAKAPTKATTKAAPRIPRTKKAATTK